MGRAERLQLIKDLQSARGNRLCIVYVTSTRPGHEIQIADDVVRQIYDHLEAHKNIANENGVDLFLHSNGGSGTAPWRLVSMIRTFTKKFSVLIPHHSFSAGTLIALGADEIVMHRMGCLGPIDPSVANIFNPPNPFAPNQTAPISVEDVSSYLKFIKNDIGIAQETQLVSATQALTDKVHPLALGNVQRHHQQSRMMATNLLKQHMKGDGVEGEIETIIDHLKSNISFHGHPISRDEAKTNLNLKVVTPTEEVETLMWNLYSEYEAELKINEPFFVAHEIETRLPAQSTQTQPVTVAQIVTNMQQLAGLGIGLGAVTATQLVELAAAMIPIVNGFPLPSNTVNVDGMKGAFIESILKSQVFLTDITISRIGDNLKHEVRWQRWEDER